jgi:hypothetical protein
MGVTTVEGVGGMAETEGYRGGGAGMVFARCSGGGAARNQS